METCEPSIDSGLNTCFLSRELVTKGEKWMERNRLSEKVPIPTWPRPVSRAYGSRRTSSGTSWKRGGRRRVR